MQPPLGVEQQQAKAPEIDHARSGTALAGPHHDRALSHRVDEGLLPPYGIPSLVAILGPVVISHHEVAGGAGVRHGLYLRDQPPLRFLPFRVAGGGKALGIRVVAQEHHHSPRLAGSQVSAQGLEHRLSSGIGISCVTDEIEAGLHLCRRQRRNRGRHRRLCAGTCQDAQQPDHQTRPKSPSHLMAEAFLLRTGSAWHTRVPRPQRE